MNTRQSLNESLWYVVADGGRCEPIRHGSFETKSEAALWLYGMGDYALQIRGKNLQAYIEENGVLPSYTEWLQKLSDAIAPTIKPESLETRVIEFADINNLTGKTISTVSFDQSKIEIVFTDNTFVSIQSPAYGGDPLTVNGEYSWFDDSAIAST